MKQVYVVNGICRQLGTNNLESHVGLIACTSENEAVGRQSTFLLKKDKEVVTCYAQIITETCATLLAEVGKIYPTEDAYMAACRAEHWRTAQLRAHSIEPIDLTKVEGLTHYPPDGFDFAAAEARR